MRSYEYLRGTHREDSKRTKILRLRNIAFKGGGGGGELLDHNSKILHSADMVIFTFDFQKNRQRNKTVHMFKTADDILCPVKAWAHTIRRILNTVPGACGDTKVYAYNHQGKTQDIDSGYARARLKGVVELLGKETLGFTKDDVGLHSIRSGGAMAMFLSGVSTIIMQRVGRWESDAFHGIYQGASGIFNFGGIRKNDPEQILLSSIKPYR